MYISPVSFGKVVKVLAPHHEAVRIANAANGAETVSPDVQKQVQDIFDDTEQGHALAISFRDDSDVSYILSGKESRDYTRDLYHHTLYVIDTKRTCPLEDAFRKVVKANQEFCKRTHDLVEKTKENFMLKIYPNGEKVEVVKENKD